MATFTLEADLNELTGEDVTRAKVARIRVSHQIRQGSVAYPLETPVELVNGTFSVELPADAEPSGYVFYVTIPQLGTAWAVGAADAGETVNLGDYVPTDPVSEGIVRFLTNDAILTDNGDGTGTIATS